MHGSLDINSEIVADKINLFGNDFDKSIDALSLDFIADTKDLICLKKFPNLQYLRLSNSNIDDEGLLYVSKCATIDNLNLQCTAITDKGIHYLTRMGSLKYLRLKECDSITNDCIPYLNKMSTLEDLQIQETGINQNGLGNLALQNLRFICLNIWNDNFTYDFLIKYSYRFPDCEIVAKGKGVFEQGAFDGNWS